MSTQSTTPEEDTNTDRTGGSVSGREPADTAGTPATERGRRGTPLLATVAVVAVLAGVALGRFLLAPPAAPGPAAPTASRTLADQVAQLERAVEADPADLASWQALGDAYLGRALEVGDPSFYDLADAAFDRADDIEPDAPGTLLGRGALALSLHEFDQALELGEAARAALPDNARAYGIVVDAHVELGHYEQAATELQGMLDRRPGLPALARASYLRELNGDLDGAIEAMRQAELAGGPRQGFQIATVGALLGDLYFSSADLPAAQAAYERALNAAPAFVPAQVGLARVQAATGDEAGAVDELEALVERFPHPEALILLGELQERLGREADAADTRAVVRAIAALQEDAGQVVDLEMAVFEADLGDDPDRAVALARRTHAARPDNIFVADALGWALHRAGDPEAALPHIESALRLGTADATLHYHAAQIYAALGQTEQAREHLGRVAETNPWFSFAHLEAAGELAAELELDAPAAWAGP